MLLILILYLIHSFILYTFTSCRSVPLRSGMFSSSLQLYNPGNQPHIVLVGFLETHKAADPLQIPRQLSTVRAFIIECPGSHPSFIIISIKKTQMGHVLCWKMTWSVNRRSPMAMKMFNTALLTSWNIKCYCLLLCRASINYSVKSLLLTNRPCVGMMVNIPFPGKK